MAKEPLAPGMSQASARENSLPHKGESPGAKGSERCPYVGLQDRPQQAQPRPDPHHRCYVSGEPERVGSAFQAAACLKSTYHNCRRFTALAIDRDSGNIAESSRRMLRRTGIPSVLSDEERLEERIHPAATPTSLALSTESAATAARTRRPVNPTEMAVLSLAVGIVLALLFTGYAVVYRMRVGPGMSAPPAIAQGPQLSTAPSPTVVTPAPLPTVTEPFAAPNATAPPTLIPEPTLPLPVRTPFGQSPKPTPTVRPPASSPPTRLTIPKIGLDIPVVQVGIKTVTSGGKSKTVWADVPNAGGFHQTSAYPGNPGNTVINGHRDILGSVFRHLDQVEVGDAIEIYVGDAVYPYLVSETLIVPETFASAEQRAENQRLIGYMPEERLTLVTCTPVGLATHRLLVIAEPPAQAAPQMSEAGSDDSP